MADVFVSYGRADKSRAVKIAQSLEKAGYSVFCDVNLEPGDTWDRQIERELTSARSVVVLWSKSSIERQWVRNEARLAMNRSVLCPAFLEACEIPVEFSHVQAVDLGKSTFQAGDPAWDSLLAAVARRVRPNGDGTSSGESTQNKFRHPPSRLFSKAKIGLGLLAIVVVIVVAVLIGKNSNSPNPADAAETATTTEATEVPGAGNGGRAQAGDSR